MSRNAFPSKFGPRGRVAPITGPLASIRLKDEQRELIDRITVGLFLDMQNKSLSDVMAACYLTGCDHGISAFQKGNKDHGD